MAWVEEFHAASATISGHLIANTCSIINYAFIETLPLEFFYLDTIASVFGGYQERTSVFALWLDVAF